MDDNLPGAKPPGALCPECEHWDLRLDALNRVTWCAGCGAHVAAADRATGAVQPLASGALLLV